ncbi:MAG: hypothetical protein EXR11_04235 [Rhodospirillaceae bacterium]|nr:hypothetical protein [Rhodospirillaceae bacterium]
MASPRLSCFGECGSRQLGAAVLIAACLVSGFVFAADEQVPKTQPIKHILSLQDLISAVDDARSASANQSSTLPNDWFSSPLVKPHGHWRFGVALDGKLGGYGDVNLGVRLSRPF